MKTPRATLVLWIALALRAIVWGGEGKPVVTGEQALKELLAGNARYVKMHLAHPHETVLRRTQVAGGQHPLAVILGCSDSRVPPEIVFDQGLGDLFAVRVAGNVVDDVVLGSIEDAVEHLGTPLVVVLGHQGCGAVETTVKGGETQGHIGHLVQAIRPAVEKTKGQPGDRLDNAVRANVGMVVQQLRSSEPTLVEFLKKSGTKIVGAYYDLHSGKVEFLVP